MPAEAGGASLHRAATLRSRAIATKSSVRRHLLIYAGVTPFVVFAVFPVAWMAVTAFKQDADLYRVGQAPFWFHRPPTLEHFERMFTQTYFTTQLLNTLQLAACLVTITMVALARESLALDPWPITASPDNFVIVVAGGGHPTNSYWLQGYSPGVVGRSIDLPSSFEGLLADAERDLGPR